MNKDNHPEKVAAAVHQLTSTAVGYWRSCVLFAANRLELFTMISTKSVTALEVAQELQLHPHGTKKLLDACVSLDLLINDGELYKLSEQSQLLLNRSSKAYIGHWISHLDDMLLRGNWQRLDEGIRTGRAVDGLASADHFTTYGDPFLNWLLGMHEVGVAGQAELLVSAIPLDGIRTLLDVGGGPGTYSIYFCRKYPKLRATILDSSDVLATAKDLVNNAQLADRISLASVDFCTQDIGAVFDVVLLSNVLHMYDREAALLMLRNAARHLVDDGHLLIQEWVIHEDVPTSKLPSLFNLHILINPGGDVYRLSELKDMLDQADFTLETFKKTPGLYDIAVARKKRT